MQAHQLETFARFLEEHPGFSPLLMGEDALVCGFQVGGTFLRIEEMEIGIDAKSTSSSRRKDNRLDAEIEVPDSLFFVITPCAICGGQFYVTTLGPWMKEYTCPDCQRLRLDTQISTVSRESDAASL
jgi:hypothetical protein